MTPRGKKSREQSEKKINSSNFPEKNIYPIKLIREELNMSQLEFAIALNVTPTTVSRWERGIAEPTFTLSKMRKFCELTGKNFYELPEALGKEYKFE